MVNLHFSGPTTEDWAQAKVIVRAKSEGEKALCSTGAVPGATSPQANTEATTDARHCSVQGGESSLIHADSTHQQDMILLMIVRVVDQEQFIGSCNFCLVLS